jgi:hypothetical protein
MSETLFEPHNFALAKLSATSLKTPSGFDDELKFKNTYTLTEYIKTNKLVVLIDFEDEDNGMFENLLDLRKMDYFMEHIENEIWQYTFDTKLKQKVEFIINKYKINVLKIKDI